MGEEWRTNHNSNSNDVKEEDTVDPMTNFRLALRHPTIDMMIIEKREIENIVLDRDLVGKRIHEIMVHHDMIADQEGVEGQDHPIRRGAMTETDATIAK